MTDDARRWVRILAGLVLLGAAALLTQEVASVIRQRFQL